MNSTNTLLKFIAGCLIVLLLGAILCTAGFGLGFLAARYNASNARPPAISRDDNNSAPTPPAPTALPPRRTPAPPVAEPTTAAGDQAPTPATTPAAPADVTPENFDIFWEAIDLLDQNFNGDTPQNEALTTAAISGIDHIARGCRLDSSAPPPPHLQPSDAPHQAPANFDQFWQAANDAYSHCGSTLFTPEELPYIAFAGVAEALGDDYTALLSPDRAEQFRIELDSTFEGIGATVNQAKDGGVLIVRPFPGSPAEKAGLRNGDIITAVDDKDITHLTLDEAIRLIRGPADSQVTLTVTRTGQNQPLTVQVTRARIDIPVLTSETLDGNLLHISLFDFSARGGQELRQTLTDAIKNNTKGIIFDLRGNPGGRLDVAIDIASLFIADGIVVTESGQRNLEHKATGKAIVPPSLPLIVLIDGGSASASEIVAGALQDYQRAPLLGETTFGKGSVQSLFDLSDGSLLRVTTSHWFTPKGRQIEKQGLTPDIPVTRDPKASADNQLQAAIDHLLKK